MVAGASPYTPPVTRATFRRSWQMAVLVAVVAVGVLVVLGYALYGVFLAVGVGLGVANSYSVMRAVANFATTQPSKAKFSGSVLARLAVITVLALACAYFFRPAGIAVFAGLALFQFLAIVSSMLPLIKEIRQK